MLAEIPSSDNFSNEAFKNFHPFLLSLMPPKKKKKKDENKMI